jgi:hypothetical protein
MAASGAAEGAPMAETNSSSYGPFEPKLMDKAEELAFELHAQEGAIWTGGWMLIGIVTFAFTSLAFAYFYLRSANNEHLWRPGAITAPTALGAAIFTIVVASALLNLYGTSRLRKGLVLDWEVSGGIVLFGLLVAAALQILELTKLPFFPGSSGYASCFVGWAVMNTGLLLACAYWMETVLARSVRLRRAVAEDGGPARSILPPARLFRMNVVSFMSFLLFAALIELFFWVMFYVA